MNNKKYFNVVSLLIIGPFIITAIIWLKWRFDELQMQQNAETMIRTIDSIKNETGFYPDNLIYLESDSGVGPFYEKKNDSTYTVYFCLGFDEYYIYDSEPVDIQLPNFSLTADSGSLLHGVDIQVSMLPYRSGMMMQSNMENVCLMS